jgi:hypothetical protein
LRENRVSIRRLRWDNNAERLIRHVGHPRIRLAYQLPHGLSAPLVQPCPGPDPQTAEGIRGNAAIPHSERGASQRWRSSWSILFVSPAAPVKVELQIGLIRVASAVCELDHTSKNSLSLGCVTLAMQSRRAEYDRPANFAMVGPGIWGNCPAQYLSGGEISNLPASDCSPPISLSQRHRADLRKNMHCTACRASAASYRPSRSNTALS